MTTLAIRFSCALALVACAHGTIIDFNNIPSGSPASFNLPGILEFRAEFGFFPPFEGASEVSAEATVLNGYVAAVSPYFKFLYPDGEPIITTYFSRISGRFLQPVSDVSLDLFTWRHGVLEWDFGGLETQDDPTALFSFETFHLTGSNVTQFSITNVDEASNLDAGIWLDNIRFKLAGQSVPDAGSTVALMAAALCGMLLVHARMNAVRQ